MKRTVAFLLIAGLALVLAGCGGKQQAGVPATVATVDGKPIPGSVYYEYLNMAYGRQVLPMLVDQLILLNWAEKEGVSVTEAQIDKQVEILKRDGTYDDQVTSAGSEQAARDRYREFQARINLGEKLNKFTDAELRKIFDDPNMKRRYTHSARKRVVVIVNTNSKKIDEAEKAVKNGMDFEAAAVKYSDPQFVVNGPVKTFIEKGQGPQGLQDAAEPLKVDEVSKPFAFTLSPFGKLTGIIKVIGEQPKSDLKFDDVKDEIKGLAALQKTMTPDFQKKLEEQKKKADIVIELPQYKFMVDQIKNPPPPPPMGMPTGPGGRPGAPTRGQAPR
jgi:foldase protein PrsA